jgi:homopolymeric O-antigen transport system ATP-binding protein
VSEARKDIENAIIVQNVSKKFRIYRDRKSNLKEAVTQRKRHTRYDEFQALKNVSLDIARGSTFGIVGHNGSGKSTMLKLLSNIHKPTSGRIEVRGRVSAMLELGAGFHPELSGRENIYLNGAILGLNRKRIDAAMDDIIEFSGLGDFIEAPVKVYSSGMYVRLGFSIAVNLDPEILIVDEIVAVGDEEFQRRCFDYMMKLRRSGVTIIVVTHSMALVEQLCDRAAWLDHGEIKAIGSPNEVIKGYLTTVNAAESERLGQQIRIDGDTVRRGTGEVEIDRVEFIDAVGHVGVTGRNSELFTARIHYSVKTPIERPIFSLGFLNEKKVYVAGPNSTSSKLSIDRLESDGYVDFTVDALTLAPGNYDVSASVTDSSMQHVYDQREGAFALTVQPGQAANVPGVVSMDGNWSLSTTPVELAPRN